MEHDILVVKYGSASVTGESGMDERRLAGYAGQLTALQEQYRLVVVSSGSIAVGQALWKSQGRSGVVSDQTLATLGSARSFEAWQRCLAERGLLAGQLLVTHREIDDPGEGGMLLKVLQDNLRAGVVTIVNENDALSDAEIAHLSYGGDNDGLAAHLAVALGAAKLCLLTGVGGLYDHAGRVVRAVGVDDLATISALAGEATAKGRGGMKSKISAALWASDHGIDVYIGDAATQTSAILNRDCGTYFERVTAINRGDR